ncbi:MAG: hypothetical protein V3V18_11940 [Methylococcales bacterium]
MDTKTTKSTVLDLPKHGLNDDFSLFLNGFGFRCLHFDIHLLPQGFLVIGRDGTCGSLTGLAAA